MDSIMQLFALLWAHNWLAATTVLTPIFFTLLTDRAKFFPEWQSPWRTFLGTVVTVGGSALELANHGTGLETILMTAILPSASTLIAEFWAAIHSKGTGGGDGGASNGTPDPNKPFPPPSKSPVIAAMVAAGYAMTVLAGACIPKPAVKSVVDVTKGIVEEVCSPGDPTLDACIDKLLSDSRVVAAKKESARRAGAAQ